MKIIIEKHTKDHALVCKSVHSFADDSVKTIYALCNNSVSVYNNYSDMMTQESMVLEDVDYIDIKGAMRHGYQYEYYDHDTKEKIIYTSDEYPYYSVRNFVNSKQLVIQLYSDATRLSPAAVCKTRNKIDSITIRRCNGE